MARKKSYLLIQLTEKNGLHSVTVREPEERAVSEAANIRRLGGKAIVIDVETFAANVAINEGIWDAEAALKRPHTYPERSGVTGVISPLPLD